MKFKIVSLLLIVLFLFNNLLYAEGSLRIPSSFKDSRGQRRIGDAIRRRGFLAGLVTGAVSDRALGFNGAVPSNTTPGYLNVMDPDLLSLSEEAALEKLFSDAGYPEGAFPAMRDVFLTAYYKMGLGNFSRKITVVKSNLQETKPEQYLEELKKILGGDEKSLVPVFRNSFLSGNVSLLGIFISGLNLNRNIFEDIETSDEIDAQKKGQIKTAIMHVAKIQFLYFILKYIGLDAKVAFGPDRCFLVIDNPMYSAGFLIIVFLSSDDAVWINTPYKEQYKLQGSYLVPKDMSGSGSVSAKQLGRGDDTRVVDKDTKRPVYLYMMYMDDRKPAHNKYTRSATAAIYSARAYVYTALREGNLAIEECDNAIKSNPFYDQPYYNKGVAYASLFGNLDAAGQCYDEALRVNPLYALAYSNRAGIYYKTKDFLRAKDLYEKAIASDLSLYRAYYNLAQIHRHILLNYQEAQQYCEQAIKLNPRSQGYQNALADIKENIKSSHNSIKECKKQLEGRPHNAAELWCTIGVLSYRIGKHDDAREAFAKTDPLSGDLHLGPDVYFTLGWFYYNNGEKDRAIESWRRTLAQNKEKIYALPDEFRQLLAYSIPPGYRANGSAL